MKTRTFVLAILLVLAIFILMFDKFQNLGYEKLTCKFGLQNSCNIINRVANTYFMSGDIASAKPLMQLSCNAKFYKSCTNLGSIFNALGDQDNAIKYHKISCDGGFYGGCDNLAKQYFLSKNYKESAQIYQKQCENENNQACFSSAISYLKLGEFNKALPNLTKACDGKIADSCSALGVYYILQNDIDSAIKSYSNGCELKDIKSCKMQKTFISFKFAYSLAKVKCKDYKSCKEIDLMDLKFDELKQGLLKIIDKF